MSRRGLFGVLAAVAATCGLGTMTTVAASPRRYGPMSVGRHRALCMKGVHLHVWHRGQDITRRCMFADDTGDGMAEVQLLNTRGKPYARRIPDGEYGAWPGEMELAKEIVYGVTFKEGAPL